LVLSKTVGGAFPNVLFYLVASYLLIAYAWLRYVSKNLTVIHQPDRRSVLAGEDLSLKIRLYNEGFLPVPWIEITDLSPVAVEPYSTTASLDPLKSAVIGYSWPSMRRGRPRIGPLRLRLSDPLGAFSLGVTTNEVGRITVYPRPVRLGYFPLPALQPYGQARRNEQSLEDRSQVSELRQWTTGENPKFIDWKVSARHGKLLARRFELRAGTDVYVLFDLFDKEARTPVLSDTAPAPEPLWTDRVVDAGLAVAGYAIRQGHRVALWGAGMTHYRLPAGQGARQLEASLQLATNMLSGSGADIMSVLEAEWAAIPARTAVVLVTRRLDQRMAESLERASRRGHHVVCVHTPPDGAHYSSVLWTQVPGSNVQVLTIPPRLGIEALLGRALKASSDD
jgi:uncharacterized protein (DUF58 family)